MGNQDQPNIIFITCDHLRADLLGCAGNEVIQTPHIDQLAQRGVRFTQAYATSPMCVPSRAGLMTGLEGHSLGLINQERGFELPVEETLPNQLSKAGYQTLVVGKMHAYPERCHRGFDNMILCEEGRLFGEFEGKNRGYDDYEIWLAEQGYAGHAFSHGLGINDYSMTPWHLPDYLHPTEWIGYEACKQIKRRDWTRPLFLWISFTAPHPPITPLSGDLLHYESGEIPKPKVGEWAKNHSNYHASNITRFGDLMTDKRTDLALRGFYASVTQVDRQINRIMGTLMEEGLIENTWVIFTSDHGDNLGDHGLWQKGNFLRGSCNIPMIIAPPLGTESRGDLGDEWHPGTVNDSVVGLIDILPTFVDIANAQNPKHVDGKSLISLVTDPKQSVREELMGEFGKVGERTFMLTDGKWKYIWYEEDDKELLFHIEKDPDEMDNHAETDASLCQEWRKKLAKKLSERDKERAVKDQKLRPVSLGHQLTAKELNERHNRMFKHWSAKGLH